MNWSKYLFKQIELSSWISLFTFFLILCEIIKCILMLFHYLSMRHGDVRFNQGWFTCTHREVIRVDWAIFIYWFVRCFKLELHQLLDINVSEPGMSKYLFCTSLWTKTLSGIFSQKLTNEINNFIWIINLIDLSVREFYLWSVDPLEKFHSIFVEERRDSDKHFI